MQTYFEEWCKFRDMTLPDDLSDDVLLLAHRCFMTGIAIESGHMSKLIIQIQTGMMQESEAQQIRQQTDDELRLVLRKIANGVIEVADIRKKAPIKRFS